MPNVNNAAIVPSSAQPIADGRGFVTTTWQRFFNALVSAAAPIQPVTLTGSPFSYRAGSGGNLAVSGGTVSAITITRGTTAVPTGATSGTFPVANGDVVSIVYTVAPTVSFIPA